MVTTGEDAPRRNGILSQFGDLAALGNQTQLLLAGLRDVPGAQGLTGTMVVKGGMLWPDLRVTPRALQAAALCLLAASCSLDQILSSIYIRDRGTASIQTARPLEEQCRRSSGTARGRQQANEKLGSG